MKVSLFKSLSVALLLGISFSLTACLNDNEESSVISKEEKQQAVAQLMGQYSGVLKYSLATPGSPSNELDSVKVTWSIDNDSVIMLHNVPTKVFAPVVKNDTELQKALMEGPATDVKCAYNVVRIAPITFAFLPYSTDIKVNYKDKEHVVRILFVNNYASAGAYNPRVRIQMGMNIFIGGYRLDSNPITPSESYPYVLTGRKSPGAPSK